VSADESAGIEPATTEPTAPIELLEITRGQMLDLAERLFIRDYAEGQDQTARAEAAVVASAAFGLAWIRICPKPKRVRKPRARK